MTIGIAGAIVVVGGARKTRGAEKSRSGLGFGHDRGLTAGRVLADGALGGGLLADVVVVIVGMERGRGGGRDGRVEVHERRKKGRKFGFEFFLNFFLKFLIQQVN